MPMAAHFFGGNAMHNRFRWIRVRRATLGAALIGILAIAPAANARVTQINITTVESPTFAGASFGSVGQYERIEGTFTGTVDPAIHPTRPSSISISPRRRTPTAPSAIPPISRSCGRSISRREIIGSSSSFPIAAPRSFS
jgi:hypothetical protein